LLNYLLQNQMLAREDVEFYLAHTTQIHELEGKYEWRDILTYDCAYREKQAAMGFQWGSAVPHLDIAMIASIRQRDFPRQFDNKSDNPYPRPAGSGQPRRDNRTETPVCKQFQTRGYCNFERNNGFPCRYSHGSSWHTPPPATSGLATPSAPPAFNPAQPPPQFH